MLLCPSNKRLLFLQAAKLMKSRLWQNIMTVNAVHGLIWQLAQCDYFIKKVLTFCPVPQSPRCILGNLSTSWMRVQATLR